MLFVGCLVTQPYVYSKGLRKKPCLEYQYSELWRLSVARFCLVLVCKKNHLTNCMWKCIDRANQFQYHNGCQGCFKSFAVINKTTYKHVFYSPDALQQYFQLVKFHHPQNCLNVTLILMGHKWTPWYDLKEFQNYRREFYSSIIFQTTCLTFLGRKHYNRFVEHRMLVTI